MYNLYGQLQFKKINEIKPGKALSTRAIFMWQFIFARVDDDQIFVVNSRKESTYICKLMKFLVIVIEFSFYVKGYLFKSVFRLKKQKSLALLLISFNGQCSLGMARISSYSFFFVLRFL